jgi:predicted nucleotidyltransferase
MADAGAPIDGAPAVALPPLAEPYRAALAEAVVWIRERFDPIGIVATGTIVRGNPSPSSDLDLWVLHRPPWRQRLQRFFGGVPAEVFVNPPERIEGYFASEREEGRPITAHMVATGALVLAADPVVERLRARARELLAAGPCPSPVKLTALRYGAATAFEDAMDVAGSDPETCRFFLNRAVDGASRYAFWAANRWQPRDKELLRELALLDPPLAAAVGRFRRASALSGQIAAARDAVERGVGATGFFEWQSEPDS